MPETQGATAAEDPTLLITAAALISSATDPLPAVVSATLDPLLTGASTATAPAFEAPAAASAVSVAEKTPTADKLPAAAGSTPALVAPTAASPLSLAENTPTAVVTRDPTAPPPSTANTFADQARRISKSQRWDLVGERKKRNIIPVIGTGATSSLEGVAPPKKRDYWEISVSRLAEGTTSDKLKTYLHGKGIEVRETFVFPSKIKGTVAARVRVVLEQKARALDPSNWPPHIRVQSWIQKRRTEKKNDAATTGSQNGGI